MVRMMMLCLAAMAMAACGCNHVYFYETNKIGLTLEARPDPTAPISGSLAGKQRVVAIVPPTEKAAAVEPGTVDREGVSEQAEKVRELAADPKTESSDVVNAVQGLEAKIAQGDAMSVLSSFRFRKFPKAPGDNSVRFGRIRIDGALITGGAAVDVAAAGKVQEAIEALSGVRRQAAASAAGHAAFAHVRRTLQEVQDRDPAAAAILRRLDQLGKEVPDVSNLVIAKWSESIKQLQLAPIKIAARGPERADDYGTALDTSVEQLTEALAAMDAGTAITLDFKETATLPGVQAGADQETIRSALIRLLKETQARQADWNARVARSGAYRDAARYVFGF